MTSKAHLLDWNRNGVLRRVAVDSCFKMVDSCLKTSVPHVLCVCNSRVCPVIRSVTVQKSGVAMAGRSVTKGLWRWRSIVGSGYSASRSLSSTSTASTLNPEEAEPVDAKPEQRTKLLVLGGNGFVGTHVCQEALGRGLPVLSISRSGRPAAHEAWVNSVLWMRGDLFDPEKWKDSLKDVSAVISCVGGFGTNEQMRRINGDANVAAINAAAESGVKRFVYISALDFGLPSFVLRGYYDGKKAAEDALRLKFPYGGVILRPGFIHGNRRVGDINIPLSAIGAPLEMLLKNAKSASQIPVVGNFLVPPVKVTAVAKAAVRSAIDNAVPPGVMDVWAIIRIGEY